MEKKKTIVFVQNVEYPQQGAIDIFYYSKFLSKYKEFNVKVIVSKINEDISNDKLELIELGKINYFLFIFQSFLEIKKINKKENIVYVYFFAQHPFSVLLQFFVKYLLKIKTIYDVVSGPIGKGFSTFIAKITIKLGVYLSDKYIVLDKRLIKRLNLPKYKRYEVVGMGFDSDIFKENLNIDLFNKNKDEIIFSYIGALNKERNLDIFLNAFIENLKININIKLYFIGGGNGEKKLKNISGIYLNKNIFFLGKKDHKKIPDYINSSDILVSYIPKISYFEYQLPTKLIEYLACNKPVIVTNTIIQKEIMYGFNILIHNDDLISTKDIILYSLCNFNELKKNNFSENVIDYSWEKLIERINYLLKS